MTTTVIFVLGLFPSQTGVTAHYSSLISLSFLNIHRYILSQIYQFQDETSVFIVVRLCNVVALVVVDVEDVISFVLLLFLVCVATIRGHSPLHWEIIGTQPWTPGDHDHLFRVLISPLDDRDTGQEDSPCCCTPPASPEQDTQTVSEHTNLHRYLEHS